MPEVYPAIACNLDDHVLQAALPLFEDDKIQAIEWSFDTLFKYETIPEWFSDLITEYGDHHRLVGHGVYFSIFSGKWLPEQQQWLNKLRILSQQFHFDHITEHFGFLTGADFHKGAPISIPFTNSTLSIGIDRLNRIADACQCPVGLENLAFSYSLDEVKKHGAFLDKLVTPLNGFIILDLHNLYCQCHNFDISFDEMLKLYPLDRVREIHISGGSWDDQSLNFNKIVRRDTHDESVPADVFDFLKIAIPVCPNLKYVVLEQMGTALGSEEEQATFRGDFLQMEQIIKDVSRKTISVKNHFTPGIQKLNTRPMEDMLLFEQQQQLSQILENAENVADAQQMLAKSSLAESAWKCDEWSPYMLATALAIAQKWRSGFL